MEKRFLLALVLSAAIFIVWSILFPPPAPTPPPVREAPAVAATVAPTAATSAAAAAATPVPTQQTEEAPQVAAEAISGERPETVELVTDDLHLRLTSQGAAVASLVLSKYTDDEGRPLDLVKTLNLPQRALPLQLVTEAGPDTHLYAVEKVDGGYRFRWSDGTTAAVEKTVRVGEQPYTLSIEVSATGAAAKWALAVGTGMRDIGPAERANRFATWGDAVFVTPTGVERIKRKKVSQEKIEPGTGLTYAGFEDTYFVNLLRPLTGLKDIAIRPLELPESETKTGKTEKKKKGKEVVLELLAQPESYPFRGEVFCAPKEYDLLRQVDRGVEKTLHFGFFHPISVVFLQVLRWIYGLVGNYGIAIILLTLAIRLLLFPLMHSSTVSMRKMQKLQPKVKSIQEKYRKNKSDPQMRAKMNQEMMELYKVEGVNPMGGCLPMLIQLPILWALYTLFAYAIELRHAPFIFWIHDLSAKDPYYITPILMTFTMWLQQKVAPQAGDPKQQKMFRMMPLIFGIMFLGFPSGLVLYWLTNNVLTIIQQEVTLRLIGERKKGGQGTKGKRK